MWKGYETFAQVSGRGCVHRELTWHIQSSCQWCRAHTTPWPQRVALPPVMPCRSASATSSWSPMTGECMCVCDANPPCQGCGNSGRASCLGGGGGVGQGCARIAGPSMHVGRRRHRVLTADNCVLLAVAAGCAQSCSAATSAVCRRLGLSCLQQLTALSGCICADWFGAGGLVPSNHVWRVTCGCWVLWAGKSGPLHVRGLAEALRSVKSSLAVFMYLQRVN